MPPTPEEMLASMPLPMSEDFAVALGFKPSMDPRNNWKSDEDCFDIVSNYYMRRLQMEPLPQQEVVFCRFAAVYLPTLVQKWRGTPDPNSAYFWVLNFLADNRYFQSYITSGLPESQGILRSASREWNGTARGTGTRCSTGASSSRRSWRGTRPAAHRRPPRAEAAGVGEGPTWVHMAKKIRAQMERQLNGCNAPGCRVPYVPDQDRLSQCSKCKVARYRISESIGRHTKSIAISPPGSDFPVEHEPLPRTLYIASPYHWA
ncbi:hypothetical protein PLICRDRAFT_171028 [Plicaturopsis crispa FD-325 SS-3]|nr:hypothetical protein PLICRDRAFT_171028 [Plicaturopsis crispa FD-325 SS-3]